jgi:hypothetical protein
MTGSVDAIALETLAQLIEFTLISINFCLRPFVMMYELGASPRGSAAMGKQILLWLADYVAGTGYRRLQARTVTGAYIIEPIVSTSNRRASGRLWPPLEGYEVRYVSLIHNDPEHGDDPSYAEVRDIRMIGSAVQTEDEAKAIAQADADDHESTAEEATDRA